MRIVYGTFLSASLLAGNFAGAATQQDEEVYRWVDEEGVTHYGDSVPPEYSKLERHILNEQAVHVETLEKQKTRAELIEEARKLAEEQKLREAEQLRKRRDQILIDSYLSVAEIEMLRDRRLELLDARTRVTEQYLENLRGRLDRLQEQSETGAAVPQELAQDVVNTLNAIKEYESRINDSRVVKERIRSAFQADIDRFKELKSLEAANADPLSFSSNQ